MTSLHASLRVSDADPPTRGSLLLRLRDPADRQAWGEFAEVYRPLLHRIARRHGLQAADADDLVQQVLIAVAAKADTWQPAGDARFRTWLGRVARNAAIDAFRRRRPDAAAGGTDALAGLHQHADPPTEDELLTEHHHAVFRWAAERAEAEFHPGTWQAFWRTAVLDQSATQVAADLGRSVGSVYTAKSRVLRRLKEIARDFK